MFLEKCFIDMLETPCIVINRNIAVRNIEFMQETANKFNCKLRPHTKTHKMKFFADLQVEKGASGITCAKISEAEVLAGGNIQDIFIAYPMVGDFRIKRAINLSKKIKRLILAVDSEESAMALSEAAVAEGVTLEVRMEVDTGAKRTGVLKICATELAVFISKLPNLNLTGIYTFKSLIYQGEQTQDNEVAGSEEGKLMKEIAEDIESAGVHLQDISAGSSPTGVQAAKTGLLTEIRPGTYIFKDYMLYKQNVADIEDIAVRIYATVVSTPSENYAIIDGGSKTFPTDIPTNQAPYFLPGFAIIEGDDNLVLSRLSEEHGIITAKNGSTGLQVGEKIALIPIHVCTAINMQNEVYIFDGNGLKKETVNGRGMLV